jgi:hypothetical protein
MNKYTLFNLLSNSIMSLLLLFSSCLSFRLVFMVYYKILPAPPIEIIIFLISLGLIGIFSTIAIWVYFKDNQ